MGLVKKMRRKYEEIRPKYEHLVNDLLDIRDSFLGRRDGLIPPRNEIFVGRSTIKQYKKIGEGLLKQFIELGGLQPSDCVLDVGCGQGRIALPLTRFLNGGGSYEGFDIVPKGITWCQKKFTPRHPNFRFQLADVRNRCYNPAGGVEAPEYTFPYPDAEFDFIFLTSVFTHMYPPAMLRYLSEIARTLKPGRRCLITWFLLNDKSRALMAADKSVINFRYPLENCFTSVPERPEDALAFDEGYVRDSYRRTGLRIEGIYYGRWSGREKWLPGQGQDIVVASKPA